MSPPVENGDEASSPSPTPSGDTGGARAPAKLVWTPSCSNSALVDGGKKYAVVAWDLDTTGRRLIDEICQVGGGYVAPPGIDEATCVFSQYVMPYRNPNPGARRSFGIKVVNIGRYRMLKDMETGKILKTKSEVSALQEFIEWLKAAKERLGGSDGLLLACHEPGRKVLVPLLLEALNRYHLLAQFKASVAGFVNGVDVVRQYGDATKITSFSLRSLCKTILSDTNPTTASASDRAQVLVKILTKLTAVEGSTACDAAKVAAVTVTVDFEDSDLQNLKRVLKTQGTLRPIFEPQLRQKRNVRERAMALRRLVAEAGLDYEGLSGVYAKEDPDARKQFLSSKLPGAADSDLDEVIGLLVSHFIKKEDATPTEARNA